MREGDNKVIIGIGSNVEADKNMAAAIECLKKDHQVVALSQFITTEPIGITDQPHFVNGAIRLQTTMGRQQFNTYLKDLEDFLGRDRSRPKYGPREIDLDIVVWNGTIVDDDYYSRSFLQKVVDQVREL
jgi:2-amino-4-hydroxy-6-hydroxymethyldihydropteridine diphosphokinase